MRRALPRLLRAALGAAVGLLLLELGLRGLGAGLAAVDAARRGPAGEGRPQVLCLGACYTLGLGSPPEAAWPRQLEGLLRARRPDLDPVVVNGGVRGKNIDHFAPGLGELLGRTGADVLIVNVNRRLDPPEAPPPSPLRLVRLLRLALHGPPPAVDPLEVARTDPLAAQIASAEARIRGAPNDGSGWRELAQLRRRRADPAGAREALLRALGPQVPGPGDALLLFELAVSLGEDEVAAAHLEQARAAQGFVEGFPSLAARRRAEDPRPDLDHALHEALDACRHALLTGDLDAALRAAEAALDRDPDAAEAWELRRYARARLGLPADADRPALLARAARDLPAGVRQGLRPGAEAADPAAAGAAFEAAYRALLAQVKADAEAAGAALLIEDLASLPDQRPALARVHAELGVPLLDLQARLEAHPDPASLFHPTQALRLNPDGNRWVAAQVADALEAHGLLPAGAP